MASIKQARLGDLNVAVPNTVAVGPAVSASAVRGVAAVASSFAASAGRKVAAEEEANKQETLSSLEDTMLDISFEALQAEQDVAARIEKEGMKLSSGQKTALSDAQATARRIDLLEEQSGVADRATIARAAAYRRFKKNNAELTPELRKFFKQVTGESVIESLKGLEEDRQKSAEEERQAMQTALRSTAEKLGFVTANRSVPELMAIVAPYEQELVAAQTAAREAKLLQNTKTIRTEERRVAEEAIFASGYKGSVISNQLNINALLEGFDPATVDNETKQGLINELNIARRAFEAQTQATFRTLDQSRITASLKPVLDAYDDAVKVVSGELDLKLLQTNNKWRTEAAMQDLNNIPGFTELSQKLQTFRNIPAELIAGGQRTRFSAEMVQPMIQMLSVGMSSPQSDPYDAMAAIASQQQIAAQYRGLRDVALAELGNDEAAKNLADTLQAWTNKFSTAPDAVPLAVYDALLSVAEKPEAMKVFSNSEQLPENLVSGFRSFTDRMRADLSKGLAEELDERYKVFKGKGDSPMKANFLNFLINPVKMKSAAATPKVFELVDVEMQANGNLVFKAINDPKVGINRLIQQKANSMNQAYGQTFGKLARSYAHIVQKNQDYRAAALALMDSPEWTKAVGSIQGTGFTATEGEQ